MRYATWCLAAVAGWTASAPAAVVLEQWAVGDKAGHPGTVRVVPLGEDTKAGPWLFKIDLGALPRRAKVHRASLLAWREPIDGRSDDARVNVEIHPLRRAWSGQGAPPAGDGPLKLEAPWYDSFDVTETVRGWSSGKPNHGLVVKAFPGWKPEKTRLEVVYEGAAGKVPRQVKGVRAIHRAGQTFLTWTEI
ncbi:MAG: hypothetical protein ACYS5V_08965, partial [Planctomycetota bacterium]